MSKVIHTVLACMAISITVLGLVACGGGTSEDVVARVGENSITRATLNHWMGIIVSGDYFEKVGRRAPKGLVSDPPNYAACVAAEEAIMPKPVKGKSLPTAAQRESKCRQLYQVLKQQAMAFLISSQRLIKQGAEQGVKGTDEEVKQHFKLLKAEEYPSDAEFQKYLADRGWTLPVELFLLKRNLLSTKIEQKLCQGHEQALVDFFKKSTKKWTASTSCNAAYVVEGCKQYKPTKTPPGASPAVLLEEMAGVL